MASRADESNRVGSSKALTGSCGMVVERMASRVNAGALATMGCIAAIFLCPAAAKAGSLWELSAPPPKEATGYPKTLRFDEDYSYLADPSKRSDAWDPIKYIPVDGTGLVYLSLGGELRERYEHLKGYTYNPGTDDILLHRLMLSADVHAGSSFRAFVQLSNLMQAGRDGGSIATDENQFDIQQAFADVSTALDEGARATLRGGRQEMIYGSGRLVAVREGPNARRSFEGGRAMYRSAGFDLDGFLVQPVLISPFAFDDKRDKGTTFWGLYGVARYAPAQGLDVYYLGIDADRAAYAAGRGSELRHTIGTRIWGAESGFDYNIETLYQFGEFRDLTISAWGASMDTGWTLASLPLSPRLGLKANIESGDRNRNDGKLGTFNPLFPNHAYFSEAAVGAPMNDIDIQPNITFRLAEGVTLRTAYDVFWRHSIEDAVYTATLQPMPGIAGRGGRYVGNLVTTHLQWQVDRHVELNFDYTHFTPSGTLRDAHVDVVDFGMASAAYKF